ncbi:MAG: RidA family protein [Chloroflexota bacterium]
MSIERQKTTERMSAIVKYNGVVYLAGQVASDVEADVQEQTRTTLAKIDGLLAEAGSSREQILSATIYLKDIGAHFALMNEVWNAWVPTGHAPARACVQAAMARESILVEISIVAAF